MEELGPIEEKDSPSPSAPDGKPIVVGIGASAGGLAALKRLFEGIPPDSGLAFVVVVHLSPEHKSILPDLLQPSVRFPVQQVMDTVRLEPNNVYVIPPNANLSAIDTHLRLSKLEESRRERAPIDHFFRTLASTHDGHSIGVILTGTGSDGTLGLKEIKAKGGLILVQDPNDAEFDGMPQSAIATGLVDRVLPIAEIPAALLRLAELSARIDLIEGGRGSQQADMLLLPKVLAILRARTERDFSRYKPATLLRRIARRMQLNYIERFEDYLERLREQSDEARALADELLITVTSFFRDPEVFRELEEKVVPQLFERKSDNDSIRIWSVGCATGEEAYSVAMLLLEEAARRDSRPRIQIFASDLHQRSLDGAREGLYSGDIETDVSADRLSRFFQKENGGYRIGKEVRDLVVFAPHNLLGDPPFSRLDLITCRNLLIYLHRSVQPDVVALFHYALCPQGYLLLGSAETIDASELFRTEDKKLHIYRKRNLPGPASGARLPVFPLTGQRLPGEPLSLEEHVPRTWSYRSLHQNLLERYAPPSILVGEENELLHLSESAGRYLVHPGGETTLSAVRLVRDELRLELQTLLQTAREKKEVVDSQPIPVRFDGHAAPVVLHVRPAPAPDHQGFALVIFDERQPPPEGAVPSAVPREPGGDTRLQDLEAELNASRQRLQSIIEEYETGREEMRSSNEEMQSTNEELRSTMEELETSKEELQSINEELQTVNQENRHKVEELSQLSGDLQNLLSATDIATLFLDRELRIMRFTPRLADLFNVRVADRGRPISDLTHRLGYAQLQEDARTVLARLIPVEREIRDDSGRWYLTRLLPYRSADDRIEGAVITFTEITTRKAAEMGLRESQERQRTLLEGIPQLVWRSRAGGEWIWASPQWMRFTGQSPQESAGRGWLNALHPDDREPASRAWSLPSSEDFLDIEFRVRRASDGVYFWHHSRALPVRVEGQALEWLGTSTDIEGLKQAENALRETEQKFRLFVENVQEYALVQTDPKGTVTSWNPGAQRLFGYRPEQMLGSDFSVLLTPEDRAEGLFSQELALVTTGQRHEDARWFVRRNGSRFWGRWITEPMLDDAGKFLGLAKIMRDETERERSEAFTRHSLAEKEELLKEVHHRVKNNLQVIVSLLNMQASQIKDEPARSLFQETRNRVLSISSIHELLFRAESFANIVLTDYARELASGLVRFYGLESRVQVRVIGNGATLELERAVPSGMLLNELVSNACKHAFTPTQRGEITIGIESVGTEIVLKVADTGAGLPPGFDYHKAPSLGLKLVHGLVHQLRGTFEIHSPPGTIVEVRFPATGTERDE